MNKYAKQLERLGFHSWYERRLIHAHLYLTLCIIALLMVAISAEALSASLAKRSPETVSDLVLVFASGAIAAWCWVKYQRHMLMASEIAHYATCPRCEKYGSLQFPELTQSKVSLRCKKCGFGWGHETEVFRG
jgi:hypothetical protein